MTAQELDQRARRAERLPAPAAWAVPPPARTIADPAAPALAGSAPGPASAGLAGDASHELRTPLNALLGHAEILLSGMAGPLSLEARRSLAEMQQAGERLRLWIEALLESWPDAPGGGLLDRAAAWPGERASGAPAGGDRTRGGAASTAPAGGDRTRGDGASADLASGDGTRADRAGAAWLAGAAAGDWVACDLITLLGASLARRRAWAGITVLPAARPVTVLGQPVWLAWLADLLVAWHVAQPVYGAALPLQVIIDGPALEFPGLGAALAPAPDDPAHRLLALILALHGGRLERSATDGLRLAWPPPAA